jgi:hypothetical protein
VGAYPASNAGAAVEVVAIVRASCGLSCNELVWDSESTGDCCHRNKENRKGNHSGRCDFSCQGSESREEAFIARVSRKRQIFI